MKSSHSRRSKKASRDGAKTRADGPRATPLRRVVVRGAALKAANASADSQRAVALPAEEVAPRAQEMSAQTRADVERLMGQMRGANERLIVAAVQAQNLSDEAHLSNSTFDRGSLSPSYIKPFDVFANGGKTGDWLLGLDSNQQPSG